MSEKNDLFIVDDQADEEVNIELNKDPIPFFSSSKFILGYGDGDEEAKNEDEEDYYGELRIFFN